MSAPVAPTLPTSGGAAVSTSSVVTTILALLFFGTLAFLFYMYIAKPYIMPIFFPTTTPAPDISSKASENAATAGAAVSNAGSSIGPLNAGSSSASRSGSTIEEFQNSTVSLGDTLFFNLQPLSIKDTGYLGPYPMGVFNEEDATVNALKAGFRFLTLQIDYVETKKDLAKYEAPGEPTLLVRDAGGSLLSANSGSIKTVADAIANNAFSPQVPNHTYPVIVYLHFVRTPNAVQNPSGYLSFLSKVAKQLGSLAPNHLGLIPQGNFTRQKQSEELLTMPLKSLEGSFVILSNADTSLFRNQTLTQGKYTPDSDLDFWVNMQVFLDDEADATGVTQLPVQGTTASAVIVNLPRILGLSRAKKDAFAAAGKRRYVIAMGGRTENPKPEDVDTALNVLGVNAVPLDIFTPSSKDILILLNEYSDMSFRKKPFALEYNS